jgi:hypothetical protein
MNSETSDRLTFSSPNKLVCNSLSPPQLCGRVMLAANISHRDAETIPQRLRDYLSKAGRCTVCSKPFFETLFTCTYFIEARCVSAFLLL